MRLAHPNVVGFEGCGFWPDDTREYLVVIMVYVEGRRLDVWAQEENPDARAVARKVLIAGKALEAIHREHVVHRDLKEANIIVRSADGEPVVVDFGVAGGPNTPRVTRGVLPPCTLEYHRIPGGDFDSVTQCSRRVRAMSPQARRVSRMRSRPASTVSSSVRTMTSGDSGGS